jgi:hypothetical protein
MCCLPTAVAFQPDTLFSSRVQSLCPTITGNVCCTVDQFDTLHQQVQQVNALIAEEVPGLCLCPGKLT